MMPESRKKLYFIVIIITFILLFLFSLYYLNRSKTNTSSQRNLNLKLYQLECPYKERCEDAEILQKTYNGQPYTTLGLGSSKVSPGVYSSIDGRVDVKYNPQQNITTVNVRNPGSGLEAIYYAIGDVSPQLKDKTIVNKGDFLFYSRSNESRIEGKYTLLFLILDTKSNTYRVFSKDVKNNTLIVH